MTEMKVVHSNLGIQPLKQSSNCNICRNFKRMFDPSHRMSKAHQKKLNEKFSIIRAKMKDIKPDCITVHDEEWHDVNDNVFCYFCGESVPKHEVFESVKVENLGYLRHLSSSAHQNGVIKYLKFHLRKEDYKMFCRPLSFLKTFMDNIPGAKQKYLERLQTLNQKDVLKIQQIEAERAELLKRISEEKAFEPTSLQLKSTSYTKVTGELSKIPPWKLNTKSESHENSEHCDDKPVVGPTMETLTKHVSNRKKRRLPPTRLQSHKNMKSKTKLNKKWLPPFSGVWNKGRTRQLKQEMKKLKS